MATLPYTDHREALDGIKTAGGPDRNFIIGAVRYPHGAHGSQLSMSGGPTRYFQDVTIIERIMKRRPHFAAIVVYQRMEVVRAVGKSVLPDARTPFVERRRHYPKYKKLEEV